MGLEGHLFGTWGFRSRALDSLDTDRLSSGLRVQGFLNVRHELARLLVRIVEECNQRTYMHELHS